MNSQDNIIHHAKLLLYVLHGIDEKESRQQYKATRLSQLALALSCCTDLLLIAL